MEKTGEHSRNIPSAAFPKQEKLCSKKEIEELFKKGSSHFLYPFKLVYLGCSDPLRYPKVLISIPKKTFKRAVDRNFLKRRIREAYRLNKHGIFFDMEISKKPCYLGILYVGKEKIPYQQLEKKLISILLRLKNT